VLVHEFALSLNDFKECPSQPMMLNLSFKMFEDFDLFLMGWQASQLATKHLMAQRV
jgi:hypothetical protein